jgi:histidyl-tRNA synthetase
MAEQRKFQAIKGVRDILPPESALWNRVEQTAREVFATYGYGEIRLPIFEQTELFARSVGMDTDIVAKEMYSFEDPPKVEFGAGMEEAFEFVNTLKSPAVFATLVKSLRDDFQSGEISQTTSNKDALDTLERLSTELERAYESFPEERSQDELYEGLKVLHPIEMKIVSAYRTIRQPYSLSLRPEATASVCRAYIEHGMHTWPGNVKLYYIGPMFRRERPQKGRYRQFYQIGAEVLGLSDAPAIDAEVIEMLLAFFERVGLGGGQKSEIRSQKSEAGDLAALKRAATGAVAEGVTLYINSIGCKECRPKYIEKLRAALVEHINELKADSQRRVETNPLRVLDSKLPEEQAVIEKLPRITDHLCDACREHYAEVKKQLALRGVAYQENWRLVRGLDYYMRTTFEITAPGLGSQNAVCGGGRYDGLVELLGGQPTKGIGFAIGTDRLVLSLSINLAASVRGTATVSAALTTEIRLAAAVSGVGKVAAPVLDVFIAWMGTSAQPVAVKMARTLREAGFSVEVPAEEMKFKKSIGLADKLGARFALIIGEDEIAEGKYALKRLADGVQEKVGAEELVERLKN